MLPYSAINNTHNMTTMENNDVANTISMKNATIYINPNFRGASSMQSSMNEAMCEYRNAPLGNTSTPHIHMNPKFWLQNVYQPMTDLKTTTTAVQTVLPQESEVSTATTTIAKNGITMNRYKLDKRKIVTRAENNSPKPAPAIRFKSESTVSVNRKLQTLNIRGVLYETTGKNLKRKDVKPMRSIVQNKYILLQRHKLLRAPLKTGTEVAKTATTKLIKPLLANRALNIVQYRVNNAKQRSLQLLRQRLVKCNMICGIFQRLGKCREHELGRCNKIHDKKHVNICAKFLNKKCIAEQCLLSHDVSLNKMPVCRFYLQALCARENCPYLHKKLSENVTLCADFQRGYCPLADKCEKRHEFLKNSTIKKLKTLTRRKVPGNKTTTPVAKICQKTQTAITKCSTVEQDNSTNSTSARYFIVDDKTHMEDAEQTTADKVAKITLKLPAFIPL